MAVTVSPQRDAVANPDAVADPFARALREGFYAGAIALGLFVLFIGLKTDQNISNELILVPRWALLAIVVIAVAAGRFLFVAYGLAGREQVFGLPYFIAAVIIAVAVSILSFAGMLEWSGPFVAGCLRILCGLAAIYALVSVFVYFRARGGSVFQLPYFIAAVVIAVAVSILSLTGTLDGLVGPFLADLSRFLRGLAIIYALASVFFYFRRFIGANSSILGLAALLLYPVVVVLVLAAMSRSWIAGFQGSLLLVDNFGIQILIYVMLAWGLNIVIGLAGLLDLGYVAFYAVGAYAYALLGTHYGLSFWILLPAAGAMAALWGVMLGFPVLRLRGDYLAIVTLAFGEIIRLVLINWREVTNGSAGITGIPKVTFFGLMTFNVSDPNYIAKVLHLATSSAYYKIFLYYLILGLCLLTAFVTIRLRRLPVGRAWEALREDEIACRSLGINTTTTKLTAFATGAMFGGFAGSFFAARQGFVSPESFVFLESAIILAIVVLGGMGSLVGIAIAAMVMIGGTEILRELDFLKTGMKWGDVTVLPGLGSDFTPELYRMLLFGMAMVIVMLWKPRGFVGSREPTAFLKERRAVSASFTKEGHG